LFNSTVRSVLADDVLHISVDLGRRVTRVVRSRGNSARDRLAPIVLQPAQSFELGIERKVLTLQRRLIVDNVRLGRVALRPERFEVVVSASVVQEEMDGDVTFQDTTISRNTLYARSTI